jgi:hypothetical protein
LVAKLVNDGQLLSGNWKNSLQSDLKKIMGWRNAFAHGKIKHDNRAGCYVVHYSGQPKQLLLTDE